jgi:malate permease and related proteins
MNLHAQVLASVTVLVLLICLAVLLRRTGVIQEENGRVFAKLVTHVTLPALIFSSLAQASILPSEALLAACMLGAELLCLGLGWVIATGLRLPAPQKGAVILVTGFGSSSLLGYALISQIFPSNPQALTEAVVVSELGVGPALFILGAMIALYYGGSGATHAQRLKGVMSFFWSPIFISVVAGVLFSLLVGKDHNPILTTVLNGFAVVGAANTFVVALTVGVLLRFQGVRAVILPALLVCLVKLVVKPVMVWLPTLAMSLPAWQAQVLVLEGAMPSALLTVVLAKTYGCDASLAAKLVFITTVLSSVTVLAMFELLFR